MRFLDVLRFLRKLIKFRDSNPTIAKHNIDTIYQCDSCKIFMPEEKVMMVHKLHPKRPEVLEFYACCDPCYTRLEKIVNPELEGKL